MPGLLKTTIPSRWPLYSLLFTLCLGGCASHYGAARITSIPAGAQVINLEDNSVVGVTPTVVALKDSSDRRQHIILRFKKEGYYDKTDSFWMNMRHRSLDHAKQNLQSLEVKMQKKGG